MYWSLFVVAFVLQLNDFGNNNNFVEAGCCGCCCGCCRCCCCPQPPIIIQPPPALHKICHVPCCCCRPCCCRCCCCGCGGGKRRKREASYRYKLMRQRREASQFVNCQLLKNAEPLRDEPQSPNKALFPILSTFNLTTTSTTSMPLLESTSAESTTMMTTLNVTQSTVMLRAKRSNLSQVAPLRPKNLNLNYVSNCKC